MATMAWGHRKQTRGVADRAVLYDRPDDPLHHQIGELLTPDSPLRPTSIPDAAGRFLAPPTAVRAVQFVPTPRSLGPGETASVLPIVHEPLRPPEVDGDSASVAVCVHSDWIVRPEGEPPPWIQMTMDDETNGTMSFRRVGGAWRLHDWRLTPDRGSDRCA